MHVSDLLLKALKNLFWGENLIATLIMVTLMWGLVIISNFLDRYFDRRNSQKEYKP